MGTTKTIFKYFHVVGVPFQKLLLINLSRKSLLLMETVGSLLISKQSTSALKSKPDKSSSYLNILFLCKTRCSLSYTCKSQAVFSLQFPCRNFICILH